MRPNDPIQHAVLDESGNVVPASFEEWAHQQHSKQRIIEQTELAGDILVSTVFLGLDHQFIPGKPSLWFETMVFGPKLPDPRWREDLDQERTSTLAQAKEAHERAVKWVKSQNWYQDERLRR